MAFDAALMGAVLEEIRQRTAEARVDKIHQPSRDTVILQLKCIVKKQRSNYVRN